MPPTERRRNGDYNEIGKEAQSYHTEGPYPWAAILGLVVDKFGIGWALYYNE